MASGLRASGQPRWRNADYSYASEDKTGTRNDNGVEQRTSDNCEMAFTGEGLRYRRSSADELSTTNTPEKAASGEWTYPRRTNFELSEHPVDEVRQLKVAVIGSGLSGITAAALLPIKVPNISLTVFEKNGDVGGTWLTNRYPGVRCDIPAHVYQSTFSPNPAWTEEYAQGPEILSYWQSVARKHGTYDRTRFNTKVHGAYWDETNHHWRLELENTTTHERVSESFDFLITAIGHFDAWKLPDYPGIELFKGHLRHSSNWDSEFDPRGKRIATIGNGASGIQVTTELQKVASHIDHYARSRTWIAGSFAPGSKDRQDVPIPFSEEDLKRFQDPKQYLSYRKGVEDKFWRAFESQLLASEASKNAVHNFTDLMKKRLADNPRLLEKLLPPFPPHCRRLTPGPGYLEALTKPNVTLIQNSIQRFTEDGIIDIEGEHRPVDAIICSTGANTHYAPPFPIVSGDIDLAKDWRSDGKFGFPYSYMGIGTPGFPNLAFLMGPNPAGPSGTVPHAAETQVTYIGKMLRKMSSQGIRTMTPSKAATDDFVAYSDAFFPRTNMAQNCSSWSNGGKPGARIHGHWPGSAAHLSVVKREPRWEDYEYEYVRSENRFAYFGNGSTAKEADPSTDMVSYLKLESDNDLRDLHERWWDI